jgi:hypothetical protein
LLEPRLRKNPGAVPKLLSCRNPRSASAHYVGAIEDLNRQRVPIDDERVPVAHSSNDFTLYPD